MPLPDRLAVNGPSAYQALASAGYPADQLVEAEALRYLNLESVRAQRGQTATVVASGERETRIGPRVLILGDMIPAAMQNFLGTVEEAVQLLPPGYNFTFKPHPGYRVRMTDYPRLQAEETSEALDQVLGEYDLALSANSTSAAADAYGAGVPVIIMLDGTTLNLSPLRGQSGVRFVGTPAELARAMISVVEERARGAVPEELFYLDRHLPRWSRLLSSAPLA
jgi:surface carbohydrate biosynthesis protein (TIGR04326 family)